MRSNRKHSKSVERMNQSKIALQGVKYDASSSYLAGCSKGPDSIRRAFHCSSTNYFTESGLDLEDHAAIVDAGDVDLGENPISDIEDKTKSLLSSIPKVVTLGGDHFITFPILKAFASRFGKINLVQLDAHPDLYDALDGNRESHASSFARAHESDLVERHVQIGIRTMTKHQRKQAERFGIEVLSISEAPRSIEFDGPVYVTLDLDVLDPAFAAGINHYEPGGLSVREVLRWLQGLKFNNIVGADIVELNPTRDIHDMTAMVAGKFLKEIFGLMLHR